MEWQAVVLAIQILLLAAGWLLFQRARGELSARAAETPVLAEVRALQKSVKQLLVEIDSAGDRQAIRLENACSNAAALLVEIKASIRDAEDRMARRFESTTAVSTGKADSSSRAGDGSGRAVTRSRLNQAVVSKDLSAVNAQDEPETRYSDNPSPLVALRADQSHRETIYRLADSGQSTAAIAHATRLSEGEIETLLGLRSQH